MAEFFGEKRCKLAISLAKGFVTNLNTALVQEFLDIMLAQGNPIIKPKGVLNDAERKTVSVGLAVNLGRSA